MWLGKFKAFNYLLTPWKTKMKNIQTEKTPFLPLSLRSTSLWPPLLLPSLLLLYYHHSVPLTRWQAAQKVGTLQSWAVVSFCHPLFLILFFHCTFFLLISSAPLLVWVIHGLQSLQGCCQLWHGELPTALTLLSPFLSIYCLFSAFTTFLEYVFTEVEQTPLTCLEESQIWLTDPAVVGLLQSG